MRASLARIAALALLAAPLAVLTVPPPPANAADDCGSDWHKDSDGEMVGKNVKSAGGRRVTASINGYVRFCTRERTFYDQRAQKVLVGLPKDFVAEGTFSGSRSQKPCLTVEIAAKVANISDFSGGGSISWPAGVSANWNISDHDNWVTARHTLCASRIGVTRLRILPPDGLSISGDSVSCIITPSGDGPGCKSYPYVERVVITTTASMTFRSGGTETRMIASHEETDLSERS